MTSTPMRPPETCSRERYADPAAARAQAACARRMLALLLTQDGSTTRLCDTIAGMPVSVRTLHQTVTADLPDVVRSALPGATCIERVACLEARGEVMMDALTYIGLDGLPADLRLELEGGSTPIGHLLARLWVQRRPLDGCADELHHRLWQRVGLADAQATRSYQVVTPAGPLMVITETFRRGMLMESPA